MPKNKSARQRKSKSAESGGKIIAVRALTGAAVGAAVFFILSAITALAAFKQDIPAEKLGAAALAISAVSAFLCGYITVRPIKKNGLMLGMLSAIPMYFIIFTVICIVNRAPLSVTGWLAMGVMLLCSAAAGIFAANKKKKQKI